MTQLPDNHTSMTESLHRYISRPSPFHVKIIITIIVYDCVVLLLAAQSNNLSTSWVGWKYKF